MTNYAIRCETSGEDILAQKILFKKGRLWAISGAALRPASEGQIICIREKQLTQLSLHYSNANLKERGFQVINMSELNSL